jgi:hypothetical protein
MEKYIQNNYDQNGFAPYDDIYGLVKGNWNGMRRIFAIDTAREK